VGANAATLQTVRPILSAMSKAIIPLGPVGSGALLKLINNFLCGVQIAALAEVDMEGTKVEVVLEASGEHDWPTRACAWLGDSQWRHLDTMQLETVLTAKVPRLLDPQTGKTEMAVVPWASEGSRWTMLFEAWAVRLLQAVANTSRAAALLRLDWHSAWAIKSRAVERGLQQRAAIATPVLGMDEKSFGRGQDYVSILTDLKESRVLDVVPERTEQAATQLLETALQAEQREAVQAACIDMWPAYEAATQQVLPQARIVFDPFHVVSHANQAVDQVRRREHIQRSRRGDDTLKGTQQM
jgi:transposase